MKKLILPVVLASALLAGCASSYESRIASRLTDAGLSRPMAGCMAERMVDRLSRSQLKQLAHFGKGLGKDARNMTLGEIAQRFNAIGDPQIVEVVTRAGLGCAISAA